MISCEGGELEVWGFGSCGNSSGCYDIRALGWKYGFFAEWRPVSMCGWQLIREAAMGCARCFHGNGMVNVAGDSFFYNAR